ncbi:MAG: hypothetical protein WC460_05635 [Patescibacteria group bacterium]
MIKYLYYIFISLFLVFIQQSILMVFGYTANLNILLVFLVFITIISGFNLGFIFSVIIGLIAGLYSYLPFGSLIIIFLLIISLVNFLYKHVLINFSYLTNIILIVMATFLYNCLLVLINYLAYLLGMIRIYISVDSIFLINFLWQNILNVALISLIFVIAKLTIKKLNLVFLIKK